MTTVSYYNAARAFAAFDVFMVIAFTITLVGLARAFSLSFIRTLALMWLVYVARVIERTLYFGLADRTTLVASLLIGVFGAVCVLPVFLVRHMSRQSSEDGPVTPPGLWGWGLASFALGFTVHAASARLDATGFELASAIWSRSFSAAPLLALIWITRSASRTQPAVRPLFWGFSLQLCAMLVDAVIRTRTFGRGLSVLDERLVSAMILASTLALGIASLLAAVEKEREVIAERARRVQLAQERVLESERWQQLGQLARGVAHDLNNVMSALLAGSDLVAEGVRHRAPETESDFAELDQALLNGRSLTARLLRFTRQQPVEPRLIAVGDVGRDMEPMLRRLVGPERTFVFVVESHDRVMADPAAVEQVLLNLVINARDATPPSGRIDVRVANDTVSRRTPVSIGTLLAGEYVCISVEDNGCGIPAHVRAHLWEPFFTTKGDRGSGIGLPTVASLMAEMNGAIDVESVDGAGSRFRVWLPAASGHVDEAEFALPLLDEQVPTA